METTEKHSWKTTCSTTSLSITVLYYSTAVEFVLELNLPYYNLSLELLILPAKDEGNWLFLSPVQQLFMYLNSVMWVPLCNLY